MRLLALLTFATLSLPACAQKVEDLPVYVATTLYRDCLQVKFQGATEITPTRIGINQFVQQVDDECLTWTVIWYGPMMGRPMDKEPWKTIGLFDQNRKAILQSLTEAIRKEALR
jgi:hypothetical protein